MKYIKTFNLFESIKDQMVGKPFDDIFTYDNYKSILRKFDMEELGEHKDLEILVDQLPILIDSKLEDLRYFVIRENSFTQDDKGDLVEVNKYINALEYYTEKKEPEIVKIPGLTSGMIENILVNKDKKVIIIHSTLTTMIVIDKNVFNK